jgi:hypothetical protein
MALDPIWISDVRNALRPSIGALSYVVLDETLDSLGINANEMHVTKLSPFLRKLRELLPEETDRETLVSEVGRILMAHVVQAANR